MLRNEGRRAAHHDLGTEELEAQYIGQGPPPVPDVSKEADLLPFQRPQSFGQREAVEQCLRWMLVGAIPRIDDGHANLLGEIMRRARVGMAHHHHVHLHREDVGDRIGEGLPFLDTRRGRREIDDIRRQPLLRQFETESGPGAVFEEQVGHRQVPQARHLLDGAIDDILEFPGGLENGVDVGPIQSADAEQVTRGEFSHGCPMD